jgi:hypothetical protein
MDCERVPAVIDDSGLATNTIAAHFDVGFWPAIVGCRIQSISPKHYFLVALSIPKELAQP